IKKKLRHLNIVTVQPNVAKLSLYLPTNAWDTPGIASYITELLYRNGVNIIDAFLGHGDIIIVVNEPDGHTAYDALRQVAQTQYTNLALRVAEDPELLKLAAIAQEKAALPNLFFAAVHLLLLKGEQHQLAAFYPSLNNSSRHYDYVYPYFRSFVLEHMEKIREIIMTHSVQTNEVGRCAVLVPAFDLVAAQAKRQPLTMIEIGSSAGLTLLWDQYH